MARIVKWYFLLNKRLFKKPGFLLILCLAPVLTAGMRLAAREESGVLRIALCLQDPEDELAAGIAAQLTEKPGALLYVTCDTEEEARKMVEDFQADGAWIFPEDLEGKLKEAAAGSGAGGVVTVVEREDTVPLIFTREILSKKLYPFFSYGIYEEFVREELGMSEVSAEELREAYERTLVEGSFFRKVYPDGQPDESNSYLLAPMRGLLAVWLVLCGFAASMFFLQDEQNGTFSRMSAESRLWAAFGMHAVLLSDALAVLLLGCRLAGVFTLWHRELLSGVLFACCTAAFCNLIRLLCRTPERLGSCVPVLLLGMLVLCPVFIGTRRLQWLQYLLPPGYYLRSVHSTYYLYGMAVYTLVLTLLCILISRCREEGQRLGGRRKP